jgi:hypothetical protein
VSTYPVTFESDYIEPRSRLTTFFRLLLVIPHLVVAAVWGIAVFVVVVIAWFALLITGTWPAGMYDFTAGFLRYYTRIHGYLFLLADPYPPFSGADEPGYPVRLHVGPAQPEYDRLKVLLRIFYIIPAYLIVYVMNVVIELAAIASWLVIVVIGKQPKGLQDVIGLCVSYSARAYALFLLLTETYPPFTDDHARQIGEPAPAAAPIAPPPAAPEAVRPSFEPPVSPTPVEPPQPPADEEPPPTGAP